MTVRVRDYRICVDLRDATVVRTTTTVRFAASGRHAVVDIAGLQPRSAVLDGVSLDARAWQGHLPLDGLGTEHTLVVCGDVSAPAVREYRDPSARIRYVATGADHLGAPNWFARFDDPSLKAPMLVDVHCPQTWSVAGTGQCTRIGLGHWRIRTERPLAPHLAGFVAGRLHSIRTSHDGIAVAFHARAALAARLDRAGDELTSRVTACLDEYQRLLALPLPAPAAEFAFIPDAPWAAMEYPGCVQLRETLLPGRGPGLGRQWIVVLAHELAHMYFGHLVTPRRASDAWLFEALAEYLGRRVAAAVAGDAVVRAAVARRHPSACEAALRHGDPPLVRQSVPVDRVGYVKGAAALADLHARLGEQVFVAGLRGFLEGSRDGVAGVGELLDAMSAAGGAGVRRWWRDWLADGGIGSVVVDEGRLSVHGVAPPTLALRAVDGSGRTVGRWAAHPRDADLPSVAAGAALVLPDSCAAWTFHRFTPGQWRRIPELVAGLDCSARAALWPAVRMGIRACDVGAERALAVVTALLSAETDAVQLDVAASWVTGELLWRHPVMGEPAVASALAHVFATAPPDSELEVVAGRHWIDVADAEPLRGLLPRLTTRARWRAMTRLAVLGALDAQAITAPQGDVAGAGVLVARCLAALAHPTAKLQTWRKLATPTGMTTAERAVAARMFWHPRHRELTAPFVPRYFAALATPGPVAEVLARHGFPVTADPGQVLELAEHLARNDEVSERVRRVVAVAAADVRRMASGPCGGLALPA